MMLFKAQRVMMYSMGDDGNDKIQVMEVAIDYSEVLMMIF
jgi:hypothetical protein